ncbi:MAG: hypothetical protein ACQ9MH_10705 [Nitrospinales bacterium]
MNNIYKVLKRIHIRIIALATLSLLSTSPLQADVQGVYSMQGEGGGSMKISYKDENNIRIDMMKDSFLLIRKDSTLMVNKSPGRGWMAMDMRKMGGMAQSMRGKRSQSSWSDIKIKKTGKRETVAGFKGQVYNMTATINGKRETHEMVLSREPAVMAMHKALGIHARRMAKSMGSTNEMDYQEMQKQMDRQKLGGMLRYDKVLKLKSLGKKNLPVNHYSLPPGTKDMSSMFK